MSDPAVAEALIPQPRIQEALDALDAQNTLLQTCTLLYKTISSHFSSLQNSLDQKSQALDAKFQKLDSKSSQTLESLALLEQSLPDRETAAVPRIELQKQAALAEFEKPPTAPDENVEMAEALRSLCRKMDSIGLWRYVIAKRTDVNVLRDEIGRLMIEEAVDPARLVLEAIEDFVSQKVGVSDHRWACGVLLRALLFEGIDSGGKLRPMCGCISKSIQEKAAAVVETWKRKMDEKEGAPGGMGAAEAQMFLYMIVGFGLRPRFEEDFLINLILKFPSRRDMAKLTVSLGFEEKMGDIIDELVKKGKQLEAVYFALESGLSEQCPPVPLLKSYLDSMKQTTNNILKKGRYCAIALESADNVELNSLRSFIKCIEDNKLESEFPIEDLKKRFSQLEKEKAERKKILTAAKAIKKKRNQAGTAAAFRPAKAGRFSVHRETPSRPNPVTGYPGSYGYPNQVVYEAPAGATYRSPYGGSHGQTPAAHPQQYTHLPDDVGGRRASGSYGGPGGYAGYDYGPNGLPPSYQSPYLH